MMNPDITQLLAAIDSGALTPLEAEVAIQQHGGLTYILCNLTL